MAGRCGSRDESTAGEGAARRRRSTMVWALLSPGCTRFCGSRLHAQTMVVTGPYKPNAGWALSIGHGRAATPFRREMPHGLSLSPAHIRGDNAPHVTVAQFITYMDPPRFARGIFADGRQGYDCMHISGVVLGGTLPSAP